MLQGLGERGWYRAIGLPVSRVAPLDQTLYTELLSHWLVFPSVSFVGANPLHLVMAH